MSTAASSPSDAERAAGGPPSRARPRASGLEVAERFGVLFLFVAVIVVFSVTHSATFATTENFQNIAVSQSVLAIIAVAVMIPLVGGRFDVSVGYILALSSVAAAALMSKAGVPVGLVFVACALIGAFLGLVNGLIVAYLGVNSIIATLGTGAIMAGLVQAYTGGIPITDGISSWLTDLNTKTVLGVPVLFLVMLAIAAAVWFLLRQTPYGRRLLATGSNIAAARLTGIDVRRVVTASFVAAGCVAGLGGPLQVAAQGSGDPSIGGLAFLLPAIAAVFLGATTWQPGQFNVPGTLLGLFFISTTISGLVLAGVAPWVTDVFNGAAVVVAIVISAQLRRKRTGALEVGA
jgi:ribose transport system permease protein